MINLTWHQTFGILAGAVSALGFLLYVRAVVKGRTRPSGASWWTWALLAGIIVASSWSAGAPWQVLVLPLSLCLSQLSVALLSLRYGDNNWGWLNTACIGGACLSIGLWVITGQPLVALVLSILADFFASIPNFRHTWVSPHNENRASWTLDWLSAILAVLAVGQWSLTESGWSTYFLLNMTMMLFLVWRPSFMELGEQNI